MKKKIEPRLIDLQHLDRELAALFASVRHGEADEMFSKYKSRFVKGQKINDDPDAIRTSNASLSIGKKLEILCTYGDYTIVKMEKKQQP